MKTFQANLDTLPPPQLRLWPELDGTPQHFTLYGGTALALRLGHRASVDFDFFTNQTLDPDQIAQTIPYLKGAERVQVAPNTLTCRLDREGSILVSFFGELDLGLVAPPEQVSGRRLYVASLLDLAGTKAAVIQKRVEVKDYLDIAALLEHGVDLPTILGADRIFCKVEWHNDELFPKVGFILTNSIIPSWKVVNVYSGWASEEIRIKEAQNTLRRYKTSCHRFEATRPGLRWERWPAICFTLSDNCIWRVRT
jgi:hypothetical protein